MTALLEAFMSVLARQIGQSWALAIAVLNPVGRAQKDESGHWREVLLVQ